MFLAFDQRFRIEDVGNFTSNADRNKTSIYHLLAGFYDVFGNAVEDLQALSRVAHHTGGAFAVYRDIKFHGGTPFSFT